MASKEEVMKIAAQCKLSDEELEARAEKRFKEEIPKEEVNKWAREKLRAAGY